MKAINLSASLQSAVGSSGLRCSHLQAALCDELGYDLVVFSKLVNLSRNSGHCTRALITLRSGKTQGQLYAVSSSKELLAPCSATDRQKIVRLLQALGTSLQCPAGYRSWHKHQTGIGIGMYHLLMYLGQREGIRVLEKII